MPMPSEPVLAAMNGVLTSGWPGSPFNWRSFGSRSKPSFSIAISSEYSAGDVVALRREIDVGVLAVAVRIVQRPRSTAT